MTKCSKRFTHDLFRLYAEGLIDGVRVDHVDGLAGRRSYCSKLRQRLRSLERERPDDCATGPAYLVVEKILGPDETLSARLGDRRHHRL